MAGALSKREIEMIFRADTDKAIRPVGELGKAVKGLTDNLREQDKAADKGQASLESLAGTTRELKAAQDELGTARSLLTQLNAQEAALAKAEARAEETREKYAQLSAQVAAAEKPTKRLTNSMEAAERAQKAAANRLAEVASETAEVRQRIEAIIGPVANFQQSFKQIADTSRDISQGLAVAGKAADDFKARMAAASAVDMKLNADVDFEQAGRSAGLLQSQIDYISQFENRVELLTAAKRELVAGDAAFAKAVSAQEAKVGADNVARLEANIRSAFEEADRLKSVQGFRDIAAQSVAAANDTARYGSAAQAAIQPVTRLRDAVIGITQPAQTAASTLDGVVEGISAAEAALNSTSKLRVSVYQDALNEVSRSVAGLERQAAQVDGLRTQQIAVDAAEKAFAGARQKVVDLAQALATADEPTNEMAQALRNAETAAEAAGNAFGREKGKLDTLAQSAAKAGIDINHLDEAEKRLIATSGRAAKAAEGLNGKLGRNGGGFLGLKPNEIQNLGYQINDVFTSLASGIPLTQVLAQQGGQIAQIFPGLFAKLATYAVPLLAVGVSIGAIAIALGHAADEAQRMRSYEGTLSALGETNGLDAAKLEDATKRLRDYGVAVEDAQKVVTTFAKEGIDPAIFDDFTAGAANAAKVMGIDVSTAAEKMAKGFTGGKKEVLALSDEFPFLTDAERTQIRAMDDSTQQNEIRRIAFDAFYRKMAQGAADMEGPWANATRTLGTAWNGMLDTLAATGIVDSIINTISNAVKGLAVLINLAKGYNAALSNAAPRNLKEFVFGTGRDVNFSDVYQGALAKTQQQMAAADPTRRARTGIGRDPGAGTRGQRRETEQRQDQAAKDAAKDAKKAAKDAERERKRALAEAKRLADEIRNQSEQLDNSIDRMTTTALRRQTGSITDQLKNAAQSVQREFAPLQRELDEFAAKTGGKGTIGGRTIAQYQAVLDANKQILTDTRQLGVYEDVVNDVVAERDRLLKGIQEKVAAGDLTPGQGISETLEVTSRLNPLLSKAADDAIAFARAINSASPSPELAALIAKLETARAGAGSGNNDRPGREQSNALIQTGEQQINNVIERRNALLQANAMLVELGIRTTRDGQAVQQQAYAVTNDELTTLIANQRQALADLQARGLLLPGVYDTEIAKLDAVAAKSIYVNDNVRAMNQLVSGQLLQGGTALFDNMAQGIAGLLTGTQSLSDAFGNVLNTFLGFAAQFLQKIAEMIIQTLILQAVQSALGVPPGGGGGLGALFFHSGTDSVGDYGKGTHRRSSMASISPAVLSVIPRYHEGTQGAGLKRDEQLAVLQTGEKVLTEEQQRREAASKAGGGGDLGLRQVLAFGDDEIAAAMGGPAGEKTTVSHIRRNKTMIKQMLKD